MIENDSELFKVQIDNYSAFRRFIRFSKSSKSKFRKHFITKLADQFNEFIKNEKI